jgi:2-polyprenyl-3-methyl-5-hydroxy-6-metoxy-1,4-benzoquinol methylase
MSFDRDYYQRFYFNARTAVTSRAEMHARGRMVAACVKYLGLPVRRVLDAGCGIGLLRAPLRRALRGAEYVGLEFSEYLCARYGWRQGSIETYRTRERFDLVICYDVLQYLSAPQARRAIANLARLCRGALYFGALTREDWLLNCDQTRTDRIPGLRPDRWYRRELARAFRPVGCGMWIRHDLPLTVWSLDVAA